MKKMQLRIALATSIGAVLTLTGVTTASADMRPSPNQPTQVSIAPVLDSGTYIVRLSSPPIATYDGGISGYEATSAKANGETRLNTKSSSAKSYQKFLRSQQREVLAAAGQKFGRALSPRFEWQHAVNGFAVEMSAVEAKEMRTMAGVASVERERIETLLTDSGPDWINAPFVWAHGGNNPMGEGLVVAILDTGINSDHPSFADLGGDGHNHDNPLGSGNYIPGSYCDANPSFCNDKLIGAWDMVQTSADPGAPEDSDGHGSHTAGTAAGNMVDNATLDAPTTSISFDITGVAPHANIIAYDVCVDGCPGAALVAAINQVVIDAGNLPNGIAALNYSISGGGDPYNDTVELGFLSAVEAGIYVAASAGNAGPTASTVAHLGPWVSTTAASTHNRQIRNTVIDLGSNGGGIPDIGGLGLTDGYGPAPIIDSATLEGTYPGATLCGIGPDDGDTSPFPPNTFNGEIVACTRGEYGRVEKGQNVLDAGAGGYILMDNGGGLVGDPHVLPGVHISEADGVILSAWLAANEGSTMGTIDGYYKDFNPENGDVMAGFSSRGPQLAFDVLKPDVTAPGVDIFAAEANGQALPAPEYQIISGTSMSSPHNAGSGALLTGARPGWNPQQIKSAIMLTATDDVVKEDGDTDADPFDYGAGRIDLQRAVRSGLVMDETINRFLQANPETGGDPASLNLASMMDSSCVEKCEWERQVRNTKNARSNFDLFVTGFEDYEVEWASRRRKGATIGGETTMRLRRGELSDVHVTVNTAELDEGWHFGRLHLHPQNDAETGPNPPSPESDPNLHMPLAVYSAKSTNPVAFNKTVDDEYGDLGDTFSYELIVSNGQMEGPITVTDVIPDNTVFAGGVTESVVNGSTSSSWSYDGGTQTMSWTGELDQGGLDISPDPFGSPAGYLPLSIFFAPLSSGCNGDCDDGGYYFTGLPPYTYNGATYTSVLMSVNGTIEAGDASLSFTSFNNQNLPDPTPQNNILAPFWRDLNQSAGGEMYVGILSDGPYQWTAYEWENVPLFGSTDTLTFQIWIGSDGTPAEGDIHFVYGPMENTGAGGTVGVENSTGTIGTSYFYNGTGTAPVENDELRVSTLDGGTATLGFDVTAGDCSGDGAPYINRADMSNDGNTETAIAVTKCDNL